MPGNVKDALDINGFKLLPTHHETVIFHIFNVKLYKIIKKCRKIIFWGSV